MKTTETDYSILKNAIVELAKNNNDEAINEFIEKYFTFDPDLVDIEKLPTKWKIEDPKKNVFFYTGQGFIQLSPDLDGYVSISSPTLKEIEKSNEKIINKEKDNRKEVVSSLKKLSETSKFYEIDDFINKYFSVNKVYPTRLEEFVKTGEIKASSDNEWYEKNQLRLTGKLDKNDIEDALGGFEKVISEEKIDNICIDNGDVKKINNPIRGKTTDVMFEDVDLSTKEKRTEFRTKLAQEAGKMIREIENEEINHRLVNTEYTNSELYKNISSMINEKKIDSEKLLSLVKNENNSTIDTIIGILKKENLSKPYSSDFVFHSQIADAVKKLKTKKYELMAKNSEIKPNLIEIQKQNRERERIRKGKSLTSEDTTTSFNKKELYNLCEVLGFQGYNISEIDNLERWALKLIDFLKIRRESFKLQEELEKMIEDFFNE